LPPANQVSPPGGNCPTTVALYLLRHGTSWQTDVKHPTSPSNRENLQIHKTAQLKLSFGEINEFQEFANMAPTVLPESGNPL
jgi:hypothetical protein